MKIYPLGHKKSNQTNKDEDSGQNLDHWIRMLGHFKVYAHVYAISSLFRTGISMTALVFQYDKG